MIKNQDQNNKLFIRAIQTMREDLQYLANHTKVSNAFIGKQNRILKTLATFLNQTNKYISFLESQNARTRIEQMNEREQLQDTIISFEAICIIHGIMDFPMWISKGKTILIYEAVELNKSKQIRLTDSLNEKIKLLPDKDQETLEAILFREVNEEIQTLLDELNQRRKRHFK